MPSGFGFVDNTDAVLGAINSAGDRAIKRIAMMVESYYKENIKSDLNTTGAAKGTLSNRTGHEITGEGLGSEAVIGNRIVYARIHEYGGTITAKNSPYLTFQLANGDWVRVPSVTIPARPTLRPAMLDHFGDAANITAEELGKL